MTQADPTATLIETICQRTADIVLERLGNVGTARQQIEFAGKRHAEQQDYRQQPEDQLRLADLR